MSTTMIERRRKATALDPVGPAPESETAKDVITERLYTCDNGLKLAARRGSRLHMADADTWEVIVLSPRGITVGEPVGFVDEATLARALDNLAHWWGDRCEASRAPGGVA